MLAKLYLTSKGRLNRRDYLFLSVLPFIFAPLLLDIISPVLGIITSVLFLIPFTTTSIKRMHDINISGKWLLTLFIIVLALTGYLSYSITSQTIAATGSIDQGIITTSYYLGMGLGIIVLVSQILLCVWPENKSENKYGSPQKIL